MKRHRSLLLVMAAAASLAAAADPLKYRIETVAGSGSIGDGGSAVAAQIGNIQAVAVDRVGNLYLSDTDRHRVRKIGPDGIISTLAGTGVAGFGGDGGAAAAAQLNYPYGLAVDPAGFVYVADLGNRRVRRISPDGLITTVAGNGQTGPGSDSGIAVETPLAMPRNLALDAAGNLYISEFDGHRVRKVSGDGWISTVAGNGTAGFRGDGGPAVGAQLAYPAGLALDSAGALYIADSQNQRIRRIAPGGTVGTLLGGMPATALLTPVAVALDAAGTLFVGDSSAAVRAYTPAGTWLIVAGTAAPGFAGDGAPALAAQLSAVHDLALDSTGALYIADGARIRKVSGGIIQTVAGDGFLRAIGDGGDARAAILASPSSVALDTAGNLYIADTGTQRIRTVSATGQIRTVLGTGVAGYSGEGGRAATAAVNGPMGVMVDALDFAVIADTGNHRVRQIGGDGRVRTLAGTGAEGIGEEGLAPAWTALRSPRGVCGNRSGAVYVVDARNHRVLRIAPGARAATAAGTGAAGDTGDGGPGAAARLHQPGACAVNTAGDLYIADTLNQRIRKVAADGTISTVTGTGEPGASGDEGPATSAQLREPAGVAVNDDGDLFIADTGNHRIRHVTPDGVIHTIAGTGAAGFSGDGETATQARLNAPGGLVLDGSGDLYFADTNNDRVRRLARETAAPVMQPPEVSVLNAASLLPGPVAPGELLVLFGEGLGPAAGVAGAIDATGLMSTRAGGTEVYFNGIAAPVLYAQSGQVNVQAPYAIAGAPEARIEVRYNGTPAGAALAQVVEATPALFPVITNQDGSPNSADEPAAGGTILTLYATGEGLTDGPNLSGLPAAEPYPKPRLGVVLTVAGVSAEILYAGSAPGLVGVLQINARVPGGLIPPGKAAVQLQVGGAVSPPVTVWLR